MTRWRVGRTLGRTLYRDDVCVGMVDTPELAAEIVEKMNGDAKKPNLRLCGSRPGPGEAIWLPAQVICSRKQGHLGPHESMDCDGDMWRWCE
jgi:hypothetical protein